jgi:hypothetical protein
MPIETYPMTERIRVLVAWKTGSEKINFRAAVSKTKVRETMPEDVSRMGNTRAEPRIGQDSTGIELPFKLQFGTIAKTAGFPSILQPCTEVIYLAYTFNG